VREGPLGPLPGSAPRLSERALAAMRRRHFSPRTEDAYLGWMRRYHDFHGRRDPATLGSGHVTAFPNARATHRRVAASIQNQVLAALLFLYREVLGLEVPWLGDLVHARSPGRLPAVLTRAEVRAVLSHMDGLPRLMATLIYGCGLRLLECCRLRVKDVDFGPNQITVRRGKGDRDRVTMLPSSRKPDLALHLERVRDQHARDLAAGAGWVELPGSLSTKLPSAERDGAWQWVFPHPHLPRARQRPAPPPPPARYRGPGRRSPHCPGLGHPQAPPPFREPSDRPAIAPPAGVRQIRRSPDGLRRRGVASADDTAPCLRRA